MMLAANNLECIRNGQVVFSGLSFSVAAGEVMHIMGSNGSGKSSLLHILAGLLDPQQGEVHWYGRPIQHMRQDYCQKLLFLGHKIGIKTQLTVKENMRLAARLGRVGCDRIAKVLARFGLDQHQHTLCHRLSAGQKQRVALARLLLLDAKLWLLDEPFTGLDQENSALLEGVLAEHVYSEGSVILTSHQKLRLPSVDIREVILFSPRNQ